MLRTYPVTIETDNQVKGTHISTTVRARDKSEAMDQALLILGLNYDSVDSIIIWPCKEDKCA